MKKAYYPCRTISFNDGNFAHKIIKSFLEDHVCHITDIPKQMIEAQQVLLTSGDTFFDQAAKVNADDLTQQYSHGKAIGYFHPNRFFNCLNGDRFFIQAADHGRNIKNKKMPSAQMESAAKTFSKYSYAIAEKIMAAVEKHLDLEQGKLIKQIFDLLTIVLTRYYPLPQWRVEDLFQQGKLITKPDSDDVVLFPEHTDFSPLTILMNRGGPSGLECRLDTSKPHLSLQPADSETPCITVFSGKQLIALTKTIPSLLHQVTTSPEEQKNICKATSSQWRFSVGCFFHANADTFHSPRTATGLQLKKTRASEELPKYPIDNKLLIDDHFRELDTSIDNTISKSDYPQSYPAYAVGQERYIEHLKEAPEQEEEMSSSEHDGFSANPNASPRSKMH